MAHKYDNFLDAWNNYVDLFDATQNSHYNAVQKAGEVWFDCPEPPTQYYVTLLAGGVIDLCYAFSRATDITEDTWEESDFHESIYWAWAEGAAVNMAAIIQAMLQATPDEIKYFIGLVDAFRMSIWNQPFNYQFYEALARGFMQWE